MMARYTPEHLAAHVRHMRALYARHLPHRILVELNNPPPRGLPSPNTFFPDTPAMFEAAMRRLEVRAQFVDDFFPSVVPGNVGMLIPAFLGAEPVYTPGGHDLWVEPIPDLYDRLDRLVYAASNRWLQDTLARYAYYRDRLPPHGLLADCTQGPDDIAKGLRGMELYLDFVDRPEAVHALFGRVADFLTAFRRRVLELASRVDGGHINWQGFWVPDTCVSITADAATNYSAAMFETFTAPAIRRMVQAAGGQFEMHLEGSAVHILDAVKRLEGLLILEYTNNPKWPRGIAMLDTLRARLGDLPLKLLLTKQEFLDGLRQRLLPGNCIYAVGYDAEHLTDAVESPEEADALLRLAAEYRAP